MIQITIRDESMMGKVSNEFLLETGSPNITVQELIRLRIYYEVAEHNRKRPDYFKGLVQPTEAETILNGHKLAERKLVDAEKQYYLALEAFKTNGFFLLVDHHQFTELEEQLELAPSSTVSFIKLIPLIGG
ncbi:hypothetical protein [Spirosoma foliorum]|uniref:Uncharacterized protein n=1 Tax=Spirosoma foliorum TaxID=2710596 RepID=A0A7G5GWG0_9BACT|nr:hypothetical protein [Spirosoma foliorum]QMW03202.1 hypothetical protein H3H32_35940 [Spirosoma foliorum]